MAEPPNTQATGLGAKLEAPARSDETAAIKAPLLEVGELTVAFPIEGRERRVVAGVSYSIPAGPHARRGRRIGMRQVHDGARAHGPRARARARLGLAALRRARAHRPGRDAMASAARRPHRHGVPGADDLAEPGDAGRPPDRRSDGAASGHRLERGRAQGGRRSSRRSASRRPRRAPRPSRISSPAACASAP